MQDPVLTDWELMAVPGEKGEDTLLILHRVASRKDLRPCPPPAAGEPRILDNAVAIRHVAWQEECLGALRPAPADHPNIRAAERLLRCWPGICRQIGAMIHAFHPLLHPDETSPARQPVPGRFHALYATVHDTLALAHAFVYETAHNKLCAIGQQEADTPPLFRNAPTELYDHPTRPAGLYPISAVFHGLYTDVHVLAFDIRLYQQSPAPELAGRVLEQIRTNTLRMRKGLLTLRRCARLTPEGEAFVGRFLAWAEEQVAQGWMICEREFPATHGPLVLIGPAGAGKTTLSKRLQATTGINVVHLDKLIWMIIWRSEVVRERVAAQVGHEVMHRLKDADRRTQREYMRRWRKEKLIREDDMERFKLQSIALALKLCPDGIIDFGGWHSVVESEDSLQKIRNMLGKADATVVLIRPVMDVEGTINFLWDRYRGRGKEYARSSVERCLLHPAYRELSDYMVDTAADSVEECCAQLIRIMEAIRR